MIWTAARLLAWGSALPAARDIVAMAREEGCETDMDDTVLAEIDDWFYWAAHAEGRKVPEQKPFDQADYRSHVGHQIHGGMISNLVQQLKDRGLAAHLPAVLEEAALIRAEPGYPHMSTPFSQFVGVQALMNVTQGERDAAPPPFRTSARTAAPSRSARARIPWLA